MTLMRTLMLVAALLAAALPAAPVAGEPMQIAVDGRVRTYLLERPPGDVPRPTIIMLHGLGNTGAGIARRSGLHRSAPRAGFAAVFPDGLRNRWNHFLPGTEPPRFVENSPAGVPDDVGFLKALVGDLTRRGIADAKRVFLAGSSNGGIMTLRMICADAAPFAAVGLVATGMPEGLGAECRPKRQIAALMMNGTADPIIPFAGGAVRGRSDFAMWSAERLAAFFGALNGCAVTAERSQLAGTASNRIEVAGWTRCAGAPVVSYRVIGGGHMSPWDLDAGELLVEFFRDKVREDRGTPPQ
jgi:polyhydroxybutyrate depolymerase